jgi:hypothetical protein
MSVDRPHAAVRAAADGSIRFVAMATREAACHCGQCPECGSQVFYTEPTEPDLIVVSVGAFADPSFPPPTESGYDSRRQPWLALPATIERHDGN